MVDEADLVFSYGYEHDLRTLLRLTNHHFLLLMLNTYLKFMICIYYKVIFSFSSHLPKIYQAFLMSATLSEVRCFWQVKI